MNLNDLTNDQVTELRNAVFMIGDAMSKLSDLAKDVNGTKYTPTARPVVTVSAQFTSSNIDSMRSHINNAPHLAQLLSQL